MLILSRKHDERIMIGNDIVLTVICISAGQVKLGIEAPDSVSIHREEVYRAIQQKPEQKPE